MRGSDESAQRNSYGLRRDLALRSFWFDMIPTSTVVGATYENDLRDDEITSFTPVSGSVRPFASSLVGASFNAREVGLEEVADLATESRDATAVAAVNSLCSIAEPASAPRSVEQPALDETRMMTTMTHAQPAISPARPPISSSPFSTTTFSSSAFSSSLSPTYDKPFLQLNTCGAVAEQMIHNDVDLAFIQASPVDPPEHGTAQEPNTLSELLSASEPTAALSEIEPNTGNENGQRKIDTEQCNLDE